MAAFFQEFLRSFGELYSVAGIVALANIIFIDIVMSGDNAILIGMATRKLQWKDRKKAIFFGIILATILRVIFAASAVFLLGIVGLKLAGGLLLLYVVWKFYRELRSDGVEHGSNVPQAVGLSAAIWTIVIADVSMSLDNVLAVAGASHGNLASLAIGLVVSIILMAVASGVIAKMLDGYPQVQWLGLIVILFVAIEMILTGSAEVERGILHVNIAPFIAFIVGGLFLFLQQKYLRPIDRKLLRTWIFDRIGSFLIVNLVVLLTFVHFGNLIAQYLQSHKVLLWSLTLALFLAILEVISVVRSGKR